MTAARAPKKSESLEIRIPYPTKQAFMARCQADGRTASEALRDFIDQHLDAPARRRPVSRRAHWIAGAVIAAAMVGVAVPSLALPALSHNASFEKLDANHDGVLSRAEFERR
ncbi:hypothetical protein QO010_004050 [Caulobacter ginsengisoli]|uniref:EF-hand domain-containing protein n=1 Tax=Caulobacter ginsengisoli TaxID=400775 RepID=A0ABU0IW58_9CAUL|nr:EF-hand domain-containing protein [Caulobacter ginsengisoli]MDQ0466257.1 hypothetical protein [Caulobacter ginsengisoli]